MFAGEVEIMSCVLALPDDWKSQDAFRSAKIIKRH
jgi:hypothetical protein